MARYLVVANVTAESPALHAEAARILEGDPHAEFVVLVPLRPVPALLALAAPDERPAALARLRARRARRRLESMGARCSSVRLGGYDPLLAIEDELRYQDFRGIIISTLPHPISRWLHLDVPGKVAQRHPELEVRHVVAPRMFHWGETDVTTSPPVWHR
jgi:hypothetical protein